MDGWLTINEFQRIWKKAFMTLFEVQPRNLLEETEENHEETQSIQPVTLRFVLFFFPYFI
jgi:hypothetical protein